MRKYYGFGISVVAVAALALGGSGVAAADDEFVGETYAEAQQAISKAGLTSRIGTTVGGDLPTEKCIVSGSRTVEIVGSSGMTGGSEIVLDLDCSLSVASQNEQQQAPQESQESQEGAREGQEESALLQEANPGESGSVN
ncbi:hypothetical protein [Mycolicibacterium sp.]|uniref:hypothetical protein n=1 Tax=Mycolicibacterium sp. TaxID=2320850 RepID=UPI001DAE82C1|nr:hypothetical protein [Mycolicibacterium sp.]MCB1287910.1 hypothetical protein [Mycobacterium sp.]MCB9408144.1 hypothetical protein [Mycolicibacterium sp.]